MEIKDNYKQSMNSIDANFKDIYELDLYKTLKEEIKIESN